MLESITRLTPLDLGVLIIIIVVITVITISVANWFVCNKGTSEKYRSSLEPLVAKLVDVAAPKLARKIGFEKEDVELIIGKDPDFDSTVYYHFKELLSIGELNKTNLM